MKNIIYSIVVIAILATTYTGCRNNQFSTRIGKLFNRDVRLLNLKQIKMNIEGMICAVGCAAMIEKILIKLIGLNLLRWLKVRKHFDL